MKREINTPRAGYYKVRSRRAGPWLPARIYHPCECDGTHHEVRDDCTRLPPMIATIQGKEVPMDRVWLYGREVTREEHDNLDGSEETLSERPPIF